MRMLEQGIPVATVMRYRQASAHSAEMKSKSKDIITKTSLPLSKQTAEARRGSFVPVDILSACG
jgi:hypothetical protein